jgi:hypothetical protein
VRRTGRWVDAAQHESRGTIYVNAEKVLFINLKDPTAMDTASTQTPRERDEPRDHIDVFREFLDHLERNTRRIAAPVHDRRRRAQDR